MSFKSLESKTVPKKSKFGWLFVSVNPEEQFVGIDIRNTPYTLESGSIVGRTVSLSICGDCWKFENFAPGSGWGSGMFVEL